MSGDAGATGSSGGASRAQRFLGKSDVDFAATRGRRHNGGGAASDSESSDADGDIFDAHAGSGGESSGGSDGEGETADERRLRMAKEFKERLVAEALERQRGGKDEGDIDDEEDEEGSDDDEFFGRRKASGAAALASASATDPSAVHAAVATRLADDAKAATGSLLRRCAGRLEGWTCGEVRAMRGHKLSVTCVAVSSDDRTAFSGAKDCSIIRWDVETGKRTVFPGRRHTKADRLAARGGGASAGAGGGGGLGVGYDRIDRKSVKYHTKGILSMAVSSDGRYLASAGYDRAICVWDTRTNALIDALTGHRDTISGLSFRRGTHTLYSSSHDRSVKVWNLDAMAYVETLFGHQSEVNAVDSLLKERCVTAGGDRTSRLWKIPEESHLVLRGHTTSMDCVKMLSDQVFATGAQGGELSLWHLSRKKPVRVVDEAHGGGSDHWISSLGALPYSDLLASGSNNGTVRLWRAEATKDDRVLDEVATVPVGGFVNALAFANSGRYLLAGVGQEHRLGRWWRDSSARNGLRLVQLPDLGLSI